MTDTAIKAGDVVRLKSGGRSLTVQKVADDNGTLTAWCEWDDGTKTHTETHAVIVLEHVPTTLPVVGMAVKRRNPLQGNRMFPNHQ